MDVCLVGLGAIGTAYAFALERTPGVRVTAVCRSNYEAVQAHGIDIVSDILGTHNAWRPHRLVRTVEEAADRSYTYIICAFKCLPDIIPTPTILAPLLFAHHISRSTSFVLLQNGIGIEDDLTAATEKLGCTIISGCAWIDATLVNDGTTLTQYGTERLVLGCHNALSNSDASRTTGDKNVLIQLCDMLRNGGTTPEPTDNIDVARWRKVLWNASFSTMCTLTRAPVGALLSSSHSRSVLAALMSEILAVARVSLSRLTFDAPDALADSVIEGIISDGNPTSNFKPSMLVDLEAGRPMEIEAILGGVLRRARAAKIATPRLDVVYAGLEVLQKIVISPKG